MKKKISSLREGDIDEKTRTFAWNSLGTAFLAKGIASASASVKSSTVGSANLIMGRGSTSGTPPTAVLTTKRPQLYVTSRTKRRYRVGEGGGRGL